MHLIETFTPSRCWKLYSEMLDFDRNALAKRATIQLENLCRLLKIAGEQVTYWKRQFQQLNIDICHLNHDNILEIFKSIPISTKKTYRQGFPKDITSDCKKDNWRTQFSAGTFDRIQVVTDFVKRDYSRASTFRAYKQLIGRDVGVRAVEIPPQACNILCGMDGMQTNLLHYLWSSLKIGKLFKPERLSHFRGLFERTIVLPKKTLPPLEATSYLELAKATDECIDAIIKEKPEILMALPTYLLWLASRLEAKKKTISSLKMIIPYGGLASPVMGKRIEKGFGTSFRDVYGTNEFGPIGVSCGVEEGVHLFEDLFLVEVVDQNGLAAQPGEIGRILITDYKNMAMPFIRYEVEDVGYLSQGRCPCGLPSKQLVICGRSREVIQDDVNKPITPRDLQDFFFEYNEILNFLVEGLSTACHKVTVILDPNKNLDLDDLKKKYQIHFKTETLPEVSTAAFLNPEESGKFCFSYPYTKDFLT